VPHPIASTFASRFRRPAPDLEAPAAERPGGALRFWSLLPVALAFGLFGAVVWLAYQDTSLAPPVGEPPLIKAAADPFKLPPDETEETTFSSEEGTVGRLWSDAEQVDQPERLLPTPETPLSPPMVEEPATAEAIPEQPASEPAEGRALEAPAEGRALEAPGEAENRVGVAGLPAAPADPAQSAAAPPASEESLRAAEAALDRLLAEVTAMSEGTDAPAASAATPAAEERASIEPPAQPLAESTTEPAPAPSPALAADAPATPLAAPAPADPAPRPEVRPAGVPTAAPPAAAEPPGRSTEIALATPTQRATPRVPIVADGDFRIQLAAVRGEADARRAWDMFMGDLGPVLADVEPIFERADTANGVFYRVQVGPFASQETAEGLCEQLKQRNASCFVIRR
jgi:hypothetical protein